MAYVLWSNTSCVTGRLLAAELHIDGGGTTPTTRQDCLIRWGSSAPVDHKPTRVINKLSAIVRASDKLAAHGVWWSAGIVVPEVALADHARTQRGRIKLPALGRVRHHTQGQDIVLCLQAQDVRRAIRRGSEYFIEYIPTEREYRVHVFNGRVLRVNQKLLRDGSDWVPFVRNFENGYVFGQPRVPLEPYHLELACQSVRLLGLDFGAVDLIVSDTGRPYVLEVNTAPALRDDTANLALYVAAFREVLSAS